MLTIEEIEALLKLDGLKLDLQHVVTSNMYGAYIFTPKRSPPDYYFSASYGSTPQEAANDAWRKYVNDRRN